MAIQKKSLINNRAAVKKAMIATTPVEPAESGELKASSLSALSMKRKKVGLHRALKGTHRVMKGSGHRYRVIS